MRSKQISTYGTPALFVYFGTFPYAGSRRCRVRGCRCSSAMYVAFRHVGIHAILLCQEHGDVADAYCRAISAREHDFDRLRRIGLEGEDHLNFEHPVRGRMFSAR